MALGLAALAVGFASPPANAQAIAPDTAAVPAADGAGLHTLVFRPAGAAKYPALSPTPGLAKTPAALMVVYAGLDPPGIERESTDLIAALCKQQRCPTKVLLKTHNHISVAQSIGTKDTELSDQLLAFMKVGKPTN